MSGELKRMKIKSLDEKGEELTYIALVNPESYQIKHEVVYNSDAQPQGSSGHDLQYTHTNPATLQFDFLFDSTGVIAKQLERPSKKTSSNSIGGAMTNSLSDQPKYDIIDEINAFKTIVLNYNGDIHEPRSVQLLWGTLSFEARLTNLEFNYKLFNPDGSPMRVVATASFTGTVKDDLRLAIENKNSPDLTHIRKVKEGDTLPLMTYRIYGDSSYYLEVARVNKIINFRNLTPGDEILFPPLNKSQ